MRAVCPVASGNHFTLLTIKAEPAKLLRRSLLRALPANSIGEVVKWQLVATLVATLLPLLLYYFTSEFTTVFTTCGGENRFLKVDERNFHCWAYRLAISGRLGTSPSDDLDFTTEKVHC